MPRSRERPALPEAGFAVEAELVIDPDGNGPERSCSHGARPTTPAEERGYHRYGRKQMPDRSFTLPHIWLPR